MDEVKKKELRRLAERSMRGGDHNEALMALRSFNTLASPAVVLSLLDENDENEGAMRVLRRRAAQAEAENEQLRAEVEALRGLMWRIHPHIRGCSSEDWGKLNAILCAGGSAND